MVWIKKAHKDRLCPSLPRSLFFVRPSCFSAAADSVGPQTTASASLGESMPMLGGEDLLLPRRCDVWNVFRKEINLQYKPAVGKDWLGSSDLRKPLRWDRSRAAGASTT